MIEMVGQVLNVLHVPERTDRDGKKREAFDQVQVLRQELTGSGELRSELHTFTVDDAGPWRPMVGKPVRFSIRAYAKGGGVAFVLTDGAKPHEEGRTGGASKALT